jgi:hypothetical protein
VAGATQLSVTTEPLTVAVRPVGSAGAVIGAAVAGRNRDVVVRVEQPAGPKLPAVGALVKHDHETDEGADWPAGTPPRTTLIVLDGPTGVRPVPPPQAVTARAAAQMRTYERMGIPPPET